MLICNLYIISSEMALHVFGSCSNWIVCIFIVTLEVLCILDTNSVLDICVLSIFFHFPFSFCKVFIVLYFAFKSMIHLELILFKTWDLKLNFYCLCPIVPALFGKAIFPPLNCSCNFIKYQMSVSVSIISGLGILFHPSICLSLCQYYSLITVDRY